MSAAPADDRNIVTCLIVDDLEENLLALSALLRADDVEVLVARSGPEALELLLTHDVALALIDVQMPGMDGFDLAELMRGTHRTRSIPIIFVTAGAHDQQRMFRGYESGAVDFLFKPVEGRVLRSKAGVFFQLRRQANQLAQQLLERTDTLRLHEIFTAVLGHDLRGPLSTILSSAHVLSKHQDESVRKIGALLARSGRWMARMIEDSLDLTRARVGGGIPIERTPFDLGEMVERVVEERRNSSPDRAVRVTKEGNLDGDWDEVRMVQVVTNLIGNALTHGDPARPVEVLVSGSTAPAVALIVTNGGAIPDEILAHVFDPFRRGRQSAGQRAEGLGLGLYIVKQIVLAHEGDIVVETAPSRSTTFRVSLPRRHVDPARR